MKIVREMKQSIIAINITNNNILKNDNNTPILLYWNERDNIINILKNNSNFLSIISKNVDKNYVNTQIDYILLNKDEKYESKSINIQDIYNLNDFSDSSFILDIIKDIVKDMFYESIGMDFTFSNDPKESQHQIQDIYNMLKDKDGIIKETFINYIRSKLQINNINNSIYKFKNQTDIDFIIDKVELILKNV